MSNWSLCFNSIKIEQNKTLLKQTNINLPRKTEVRVTKSESHAAGCDHNLVLKQES